MRQRSQTTNRLLLAGILASSFTLNCGAQAAATQSTTPVDKAAATSIANPVAAAARWSAREGVRFKRDWGVEIIGVHTVASGEMLAFRYRILDVNKAKTLNDKTKAAVLTDQKTGVKLHVPQMDKVGLLRTAAEPKANGVYWMIFPNTNRLVRPGNLVNVTIGDFEVNGLIVN